MLQKHRILGSDASPPQQWLANTRRTAAPWEANAWQKPPPWNPTPLAS